MAHLNAYTNETCNVIHLMITDKCDRDCKYCCNKQYDLGQVSFVTEEELSVAKTVFLTGGEPFAYADPCETAKQLKTKYTNLEHVMVYSNALELADYLRFGSLYSIDGLTVSIKTPQDKEAFEQFIVTDPDVVSLSSNWLYVFPGIAPIRYLGNFKCNERIWQTDFTPATDSVFRRLNSL